MDLLGGATQHGEPSNREQRREGTRREGLSGNCFYPEEKHKPWGGGRGGGSQSRKKAAQDPLKATDSRGEAPAGDRLPRTARSQERAQWVTSTLPPRRVYKRGDPEKHAGVLNKRGKHIRNYKAKHTDFVLAYGIEKPQM